MLNTNRNWILGASVLCFLWIIFLLRVLWRQRKNRFGTGVVSRFYYFVCVSILGSMLVSGVLFAISSLVDAYNIALSPGVNTVLVTLFRLFFAIMCIGLAFSPGIGIILFAIRSIFEGKTVYTSPFKTARYVGNPVAGFLGFVYLLIGIIAFNFPIWLVVVVACWKNNTGLCEIGNRYVGLFARLVERSNKLDLFIVAFCLWIGYLGYVKYTKRKKKSTSSNK